MTLSFSNDPDLFKHLILLFHRVEDLQLEYIPVTYLADTIGVVSQLFTIDLQLYVEDCHFDQNRVWEPMQRVSQPLSFRSPAWEIYLSFGDSDWPNCLKLNGEWLGARIAAGCFKFLTCLLVNLNGIPACDVNNVLKIAGKQLSRLTCMKHEGGSASILDLSTLVNVKEVMFKVVYKHIPWLCLLTFTLLHMAPLRAIHVPIQFDR
ncbi:hypothetical protein ARMSODRAFT_1019787 [Armillaria solidipes]|uniref:Uncharacterized protein n=1 Tax=Armillaria solidipes TaxID=1076256 RepID=A0A2H3BBF1_9AGAR|nr:hypothetical protein ARMSODRAFT_1019787 [Armillaria solidipes]